MCGIFGIIGANATPEKIKLMAGSLAKRGPDEVNWRINNGAGIGATRLAIIDIKGGKQPISNEDKTIWVVQNGELYNYQELKRELNHKFKTSSDTEVYAHLYEDQGLEFVNKLRGMFAVALWDENKQQLILVRDRLGIKPLYYNPGNNFIFASEIKAILAVGIKKEINQEAIEDYRVVNYVPGRQTVFAGIKKLGPGEMLIWQKGKISIHDYWQPERFVNSAKDDGSLLKRLEEAVKYHLVADLPVGAFLSGGIDSSLIVAIASKYQQLKTFTVGFSHESYDERKYAKAVANKFGTKHEEIILAMKPEDLVNKIGAYFDEPFGDSSAVAMYAVSEAAKKQGFKAILTGDGGDEIFGGYVTYQADRLLKIYNSLPKLVHKFIGEISSVIPSSQKKMAWEFKMKRFVQRATKDPLTAHWLWKAIRTNRRAIRWWRDEYKKVTTDDELNKLMFTDMRVSLPDDMLTKTDRMSMANSIEVRVPLLDHLLVEYMLGLSSQEKVKRLRLKYLLKQVAAELLPQEIINRPKAGFHVPVAQWINEELKQMIDDYLPENKLVKMHREKRGDFSREIWGQLMLKIWQENWL